MHTESCHLCSEKSNQPEIFYRVDGANFFQCRKCGLVWLERVKWHTNQRAYYSEQYYPENYSGRKELKNLFRYRFKLIKKYFRPTGKLLEVGAASGDFLHLLQEVGYDVHGVELSARAAGRAAEKYRLNLFQGTLEDASFLEESFNYVVMYHVLEHVPDPRATLREVYRVLKPGGRVLIEVPNVRSVDCKSTRLLLNALDYPNHIYGFSRETLIKTVVSAGFKPVVFEGSFPFLIAQWLAKLRQATLHRNATTTAFSEDVSNVSGKELFRQAKQDSLLRRCIQQSLPGMKATIIAEKVIT